MNDIAVGARSIIGIIHTDDKFLEYISLSTLHYFYSQHFVLS